MAIQDESFDVSFVIPTKNGERTITKCLDAIVNQKTDISYEIIVVDGNSTDNTIKIAKSYDVRLFICEGLVSKARKLGVNVARGTYIAFVDADVYISKNWLGSIVQTIKKSKLDGAIGKVETNNSFMMKYSDISSPFSQDKPFLIKNCFPTLNTVMLKRRIIQVGNFNELLTSSEDGDLTKRMVDKGFKFMFEPNAVCYHDCIVSLRSMVKKDIWYTKGIFICMLKYGIKSWFFRTFTTRLLASILFFIFLSLLIVIPKTIMTVAGIVILFFIFYSLIKYLQTKNKGWLIYLPMFIFNRFSFVIASVSSVHYYIYTYSKNSNRG